MPGPGCEAPIPGPVNSKTRSELLKFEPLSPFSIVLSPEDRSVIVEETPPLPDIFVYLTYTLLIPEVGTPVGVTKLFRAFSVPN